MKEKKILIKSKLLFGLLITAVGVSSGLAYAMSKKPEKEEIVFHPFVSDDIFAEMEAMEEQMNRVFASHRKMMNEMFKDVKNSQKSQSSSSSSVTMSKDDNSYTYQLIFSGFKKEDVMIRVADSILTISARGEESSKAGEVNNSFYYSLSIPSDVKDEPEINRQEGKVTIKFSKKTK